MQDVVVIVPGIMGSVLTKDAREVWGPSRGALLRGLFSRGRSLDELRLSGDDPKADVLGDGVSPTAVMPSAHVIPGLWKIDGYGELRRAIELAFGARLGHELVEFAYDWRRDNRAAAHRLRRSAQAWLDQRQQQGAPDPKLIIVAHSMGGLVSRYFTEVLGGWRMTRALITFGTPYRGSLNALDNLANGVRKGPSGFIDLSSVTRSFTSVYQLLPIYECYLGADGARVRVGETDGIPNVDPRRAAEALEFHREIERANAENRQDPAYSENYLIRPVVGFRQPTLQSARFSDGRVALSDTLGDDDLNQGDGTVPRVSATPIELSDAGRDVLLSTKHSRLQSNNAALDFLEGTIRDFSLDLGAFRRVELAGARVALRLADAYEASEPIALSVKTDRPAEVDVRVTRGQTRILETSATHDGERWHEHELPPQPVGTYCVSAAARDGAETASDIFVVYSDAEADLDVGAVT